MLNVFFWLLIVGGAFVLYKIQHPAGTVPSAFSYNDMVRATSRGAIARLVSEPDRLTGELKDATAFDFECANSVVKDGFAEAARAGGARTATEPTPPAGLGTTVLTYMPFILFTAFWGVLLVLMVVGSRIARKRAEGIQATVSAVRSPPFLMGTSKASRTIRWGFTALLILGGFSLVYNFATRGGRTLEYRQLMDSATRGAVERVEVGPTSTEIVLKGGRRVLCSIPSETQQAEVASQLAAQGVRVNFTAIDHSSTSTVIFTYAPFLMFIGFWVILMRFLGQTRRLASLPPQIPQDAPPYGDAGPSGGH